MADDVLGAIGAAVGRGARAFRDYRRMQYQEIALDRQNRMAKERADQEAAEKLMDEKAATRLGEIRTQLNNIRSQAGIYETDDLGNTVIREDIFNERLAPLLEEAASIKSKSHDGADWADFYYKVNIAHRLPVQKKKQTEGGDTDLERYLQRGFAAEKEKRKGIELTAEDEFRIAKELTEEYKSAGEDTQRRKDFMFLVKEQGVEPDKAIEMIYGRRQASDAERLKALVGGLSKKPGAATEKPKPTGGFINRIKGFLPMRANQPEPQEDTAIVDVDSLAREPVPQDLGDVPGGIDINAKADGEQAPQFEYFEDLQDYLKKNLAADKDTATYQKRLSAGGRLLPRRNKK